MAHVPPDVIKGQGLMVLQNALLLMKQKVQLLVMVSV